MVAAFEIPPTHAPQTRGCSTGWTSRWRRSPPRRRGQAARRHDADDQGPDARQARRVDDLLVSSHPPAHGRAGRGGDCRGGAALAGGHAATPAARALAHCCSCSECVCVCTYECWDWDDEDEDDDDESADALLIEAASHNTHPPPNACQSSTAVSVRGSHPARVFGFS